jgi:hypothetical protein
MSTGREHQRHEHQTLGDPARQEHPYPAKAIDQAALKRRHRGGRERERADRDAGGRI